MELPKSTRLRYVKSKDPATLSEWLDALQLRVQIYGSPQWTGKAWFLWFVPDDRGSDVASIDLDEMGL